MSSESFVQKRVWGALSNSTVLFRVNSGKGYVSNGGKPHRLTDGSVVVPNARPIALGFAYPSGASVVGTSDLIGYTEMTVTPEMVGKKVAVITAIETKRTKGGKKSDEQMTFIQNISEAGGIAGFANSADSALDIVKTYQDYMSGTIKLK